MKIKELHISNFRNLTNLNIVLKDNVSILSGKNGLGKSNALNAASYGVANVILTDKWGYGENDIDSIIPKNAVRGINPEVSMITEVGTKFTKKYISQYTKDGSKVKGHTTEWYINDVACKNETEFNEQFYTALNFRPSLKTKDVNELRLFTDPLYALQKLDAKQLRQLLVELGCSVTTEELYQKGFDDLRPYGDKYLGKWDVMRKDLKDKSKTLAKEIESLQAKLETVASTEEFNEDNLNALKSQYESLVSKKSLIKNGAANPALKEYEIRLEAIKTAIRTRAEEYQRGLYEKRKNLEEKKALALENATASVRKQLDPLYREREKVDDEIERMETMIKAYEQAFNTQSGLMQQYITMAKNINTKKTDLAVKLESVRASNYKGMVTCPICGNEFPTSKTDKEAFEAHKQEEINTLIKEIEKAEKDKTSYKAEYDNAKLLRDEAVQLGDEARVNLEVARNKKLELDTKCKALEQQPVDTSEVYKLDAEIEALSQPLDQSKDYQQVAELETKINALKQADALKVQDEVNNLDLQLNELDSKISEEYVRQSKYKERLEYEANLAATQTTLNDTESLLARCNRLIQTMISLINEKATEKTGLTFVMLEENLSNDGIKEVCYATVDGIPFKDVNTATKIKYGIKFIEKLKELLGHNDLPILADRLEGIDSLETIKGLTKEQLICTRVSEGKEIEIL